MTTTAKGCKIDMYYGETYSRDRHYPIRAYWSDDSFDYWGYIYDERGKIVGDWRADRLLDAEAALGVKYVSNGKEA